MGNDDLQLFRLDFYTYKQQQNYVSVDSMWWGAYNKQENYCMKNLMAFTHSSIIVNVGRKASLLDWMMKDAPHVIKYKVM